MAIIGDKIPWKAFNYGVNCHQIELRFNSALIFTVTATSEGLFAPLEGCLRLLGTVIMVLHSVLAQYFEPLIVYILCFPAEIPLWQSYKHSKANSDVFSILWHPLHLLCPPLGMMVAVLDWWIVRTNWELRSVLWDAPCLSCDSVVRCKSNARRCRLSSPWVLNLISRLLIHEVPGGCARSTLGRFVFVHKQNAGYETKLSYLTSWTKELQELE